RDDRRGRGLQRRAASEAARIALDARGPTPPSSRADPKPRPTMPSDALTRDELDLLETWFRDHETSLPPEVRAVQERMMALYRAAAKSKRAAAETLLALRMAMGIVPKSERGAQLFEKN